MIQSSDASRRWRRAPKTREMKVLEAISWDSHAAASFRVQPFMARYALLPIIMRGRVKPRSYAIYFDSQFDSHADGLRRKLAD